MATASDDSKSPTSRRDWLATAGPILLGVVGALALSWFAAVIGRSYAPALLFPAVVGSAAGLLAAAMTSAAEIHCRRRRFALAIGLVLIASLGQHGWAYRDYLSGRAERWKQSPIGELALSAEGAPAPPGFVEYLQGQANRVGRDWLGGRYAGMGVWATWGVDLLVSLVAGTVFVYLRSSSRAANSTEQPDDA